ncbi:chromosome segregation protein SMC [Candidatus Aquicultor secundus]|uniref:Chromosome partition protein Smc n=1 Tax=Candidatus Aquicultor secundus TaxID=1973895 RepID=A0A2M7T5X3_9ACTN|nr:chromosome segregation protein SMC [Candidatus Aquicultor secundus]NCO65220.1 chromosome segregation protein SMC [Solirubrobacter sp.]PIX51851.1 MAG: chromosome segregation protein SMC [Candidatus Aquicultor secundus]PIZ35745.1 MAG: chromosome segregation protein SMC [Candidatus Aquicultor secundus]
MHLKSLTLRGFKSFAERTVLRFETGVTAIVGPNGSGKSNISDAVIWVLGEQSPRSLRSGSMDDVIFAGSSARAALGMSEVSLTLSNTDGLLPIEFTEVTITRRLYRSGESDYYINNSPCRLLDIQELLSDSGLGKGLYSIIGQGRLEETLNSKPDDKRLLIEEAAGILKHKKRKEKALKKLGSMDANLQRAKDIAQEIGRQLKPLKNQANKAQEYLALNSKLRSLEIGLAIIDLNELQDDWETAVSHEANLKEQLMQLKEDLTAEHTKAEKLQLEFETKNFYSGDISEKRRKLQSDEEKIRSNVNLLDEKAKNIDQRIGEIRHTISQSEQRKHSLIDQQRWLEKQKAALSSEIDKNSSILIELKGKVEDVYKKRQDIEESIAGLKAKVQAEARMSDSYQHGVNELQLSIHTAENQLIFLKNELGLLVKRKTDLYQRIEQKKRDTEVTGIEITRLEFQFNELTMVIDQLKAELETKRMAEGELRQELAGLKARIKALEDIIGSFPTLNDVAESLGSIDMPEVIGLLKDAIQVRPEYERAIEAVLGGDIFCVVLENSDSLKKLVSAKDVESLSLTSFIASDRARFKLPTNRLPMATWALDVITYPSEFKYAVSALLSHVYIVPDFHTALTLQERTEGEILVTGDGEVVLPNGKIIFGAASEAIGILGYQRELDDMNAVIADVEKKIKTTEAAQDEIRQKLDRFTTQKDDIWASLQTKKVDKSNLKQSLDDAEPEVAKLTDQEKALRTKVNSLEKRFKEESESILRLRQEYKVQKDKLAALQFTFDDSTKSRESYLEEESRLKVELGKVKVDIESLNERISHNARRIPGINKELNNFDIQMEKEREFLDYLVKLHAHIAPLRSAFKQVLESVIFRHDQISEMTLFEEGSLEDLRQDLRQSQLDANKTSDRVENTIRQLHEVEVKKAQLELKVTSAVQKVVDEYDVPLEKALEKGLAVEREEAEAEASALRRRIAVLGPVNPIAVEEYTQLEDRHKLFMEQIEDLQRSKRALLRVISAIEQKMKTRFVETFEKVNESFQAVAASLFPGGHAELILTDPDDTQNSGVDIIAQPGGKKLQRLSLLSGGEKSLVALAFSFALYQTKPSPFYILDEVEAALDDVNLQRFIALLNRIKLDSQILIITHQRRTMEVADSLYGVSMQADGVSRLISQKFSEVTVGMV